jgi:isoleucyl-tRNA synthetase
MLRENRALLTTLAIVSEVEVGGHVPPDAARGVDLPALQIHARRSPHVKCERCWNLRPTVGQDPTHPTLCDRCARVVSGLNSGA